MNGYTIRKATEADLSQIFGWLEEQREPGIEDSVHCNTCNIPTGYDNGDDEKAP